MNTDRITQKDFENCRSSLESALETHQHEASGVLNGGAGRRSGVSQRPAGLTVKDSHRLFVAVCVALILSAARVLAQNSLRQPAEARGVQSHTLQPGVEPPPQAARYHLAFSTDFNPLNLSPNGRGSYTWYNPGMWWEPPAPYPNIFVDDSGLNLVWTPGQLTQDTSISTASLAGSHYLGWHYGYFEVRMRWDTVTGAWPAIWMIPIEGVRGHRSSVETGELDIFEGAGHNPEVFYGTIHDWMNDVDLANNNCCNQYPLPAGTDLSQYHTYGVLWTPGRVTWYLDNQALNSIATYPIFDDCTQKYYLILGSQTFDPSAAPPSIRMQVNWVRVWQDERNACSAEGAGDELRSGR